MMTPKLLTRAAQATYVFPPALVQRVRERLARKSACLADVTDEHLAQLLTNVFFAGLETYEGEHNPIGVAFVGRSPVDFVIPEGVGSAALPLYQWKILRFADPRPFVTAELVKLAVAGCNRRIYTAVGVDDTDTLAITGLAREGFNAGPDPFIKIIASKPGCLSIRSGRELEIEYERGAIVSVGENELFAAGPVHRSLSAIARAAGVEEDVLPHYLDSVAFLVREIVAHGHGGILIIGADEDVSVASSTSYRMMVNSSVSALLRLAWRSGRRKGAESFGQLLRNALLTEAERVVEELGRLTAIDGAVVLNRDLALMAFGVILPVRQQIAVEPFAHAADRAPLIDIGTRGTRHRAGATYAADHPGSVVFVASEDGQVTCMFCERADAPVRLGRLAAETARAT